MKKLDKATADAALAVEFETVEGEDTTVRMFFCNLLRKLWEKETAFSSYRPFGHGAWQEPLLEALADAGFIDLGSKVKRKAASWYEPTQAQAQTASAFVLDLISAMSLGLPE